MFRKGRTQMPFSRLFGKKEKNQMDDIVEEGVQRVQELPMDKIFPNQFQPRTVFDQDKIDELARTIRIHGVIQPIVVREMEPDYYEIIAGERRFRAVLSLEMEKIPAIIQNLDDEEVAAIALIENLQREELTPIEEAKAYRSLLDMQDVTQSPCATCREKPVCHRQQNASSKTARNCPRSGSYQTNFRTPCSFVTRIRNRRTTSRTFSRNSRESLERQTNRSKDSRNFRREKTSSY